jgi:hypothetical protein
MGLESTNPGSDYHFPDSQRKIVPPIFNVLGLGVCPPLSGLIQISKKYPKEN